MARSYIEERKPLEEAAVLAYKEEIMVEVIQRAQSSASLQSRLDSASSLREAVEKQLAAVMAMAPVVPNVGCRAVEEATDMDEECSAEQARGLQKDLQVDKTKEAEHEEEAVEEAVEEVGELETEKLDSAKPSAVANMSQLWEARVKALEETIVQKDQEMRDAKHTQDKKQRFRLVLAACRCSRGQGLGETRRRHP